MAEEKREEIPLQKLLEAILPHQEGIYVTVLNIIQCIALAFLMNEARDTITKGEASLPWFLRSGATLALILVIWQRYISESQYLWPMTWLDTLIPFSIGIAECMVVFSTSTRIGLYWFIFWMTSIQFLALIAYGYANYKRNKKITEKLYIEVYGDYPKFAIHLLNFLKGYDKWHMGVFIISICIYLSVFLLAVISLPRTYNEIILPGIYIFEMIRGEFANNFQKALLSDKNIGRYFQ